MVLVLNTRDRFSLMPFSVFSYIGEEPSGCKLLENIHHRKGKDRFASEVFKPVTEIGLPFHLKNERYP
jgi:hypothetical protein